ncbi:hypothetical protein HELRODRAFT_76268 [Helobdella robusta]|uniref:Mediator of RNA polymerase II transcription subunit 18 n=1 Tax=Helobdella robusta TaxID=6412 RepID=T1G2H5_HELRO|nr:hypothetical protein HELRODRAFT_76268 [Helobdella robusta]ESO07528.1 hypothetical protein HELRODRAFT_76268 [Helobdella robusta]
MSALDIANQKAPQPSALHEYVLQGSILENHRDLLLNRLKGLCDMADSVPEKFNDHEMVYSLRGPPPCIPVVLGVRHAIDFPDDPWHVRFMSQPDTSDKSKSTIIKTFVDSATTSSITQFLTEMGFMLDYEYVINGYVFRKGRLKITVSRLSKLLSPGNTDSTELLSNQYLVELSIISLHGQVPIQEDMKNFADQLKPLVFF